MNDEEPNSPWQELKCLWQWQKPSGQPALTAAAQIATMRKKMAQMHQGLNKADFWGSALYAVVTIPFIIYVFTTPYFVSRLGYLIIIGGMLFASWKSIRRRRSIPQPIADAPVMEWLRYDLAKVRQHAEDSRTLRWWYLLPFLVGMNVSTWGMKVDLLTVKIPMTVLAALIAGVTYWLNQRVRRHQWLPMQEELEALLHSAETGEPLDETPVASLRPIALAMASADQAKPVEFNVAFWQIALYAEIGFVGIWFFGMLDRTNFNVPRMFIPQHLVWVVPFFLAGLLFSRMLQKATQRAVGISALGVHLLKGQILILWDEIKEVRPLRILNIRSLWLIRASGKKTIMPWTGLDRHSDLKAAVEAFAPANHPIRKYLSLLRPESRKKNTVTKTILIGIVLILLAAVA